jgi:hypothetical protein
MKEPMSKEPMYHYLSQCGVLASQCFALLRSITRLYNFLPPYFSQTAR